MDRIDVTYEGTDINDEWQDSEVTEITDLKKIEELKQGMVYDMLCPGWVETEENIYLQGHRSDSEDEIDGSYVLMKGKVPQFIQEEKEKFQEGLDTVVVYDTDQEMQDSDYATEEITE